MVAHLGEEQLALRQVQIAGGQNVLGQHPTQVLAQLIDGDAEAGGHGSQIHLPVGANVSQVIQITFAAAVAADAGEQHPQPPCQEGQADADGDQYFRHILHHADDA